MKWRREIRRLLHPVNYPWGAILMLHRVDTINHERMWYNEHLKISPEFLENYIKKAKKNHFSFVSLDELIEIITQKKNVRRIIAITLDDGYKDNYTNGLTLFKAHHIPFCIYVSTRFPEKNMFFWWYLIEDIIQQQNNTIKLNNGIEYKCKTKENKESAFLSIREEILKLPQQNFETECLNLLNNYKIDPSKYNEDLPLSWKMISQLGQEPLATIGNHTHSHISMSGCNTQMIIDDIQKANFLFQNKAGIQAQHFAYPYGENTAVKDYHKEIVQELGFKTIATTHEGLLSYTTDSHTLPRLFITERNAYDILDHLYYTC